MQQPQAFQNFTICPKTSIPMENKMEESIIFQLSMKFFLQQIELFFETLLILWQFYKSMIEKTVFLFFYFSGVYMNPEIQKAINNLVRIKTRYPYLTAYTEISRKSDSELSIQYACSEEDIKKLRVIEPLLSQISHLVNKDELTAVLEKIPEFEKKLKDLNDGSLTITPFVIDLLSVDEPAIQIEAIKTIGTLTLKEDTRHLVLSILYKLIKDGDFIDGVKGIEQIVDPNVCKYAIEAIGSLENNADTLVKALIETYDNYYRNYFYVYVIKVLKKLSSKSEGIVNILLKTINDKDYTVRANAIKALGELGNTSEKIVIALTKAANDEDSSVRLSSVLSMGKLGINSEKAVEALIRYLNHEDEFVRSFATKALGQLKNPTEDIINAICKAIEDKEYVVRYQAAEALENLGNANKTVIKSLTTTLKDKEPMIRICAAKALGKLGKKSKEAVNTLQRDLLNKDSFVRFSAAEVLGNLGESSKLIMNILIEAINDEEYEIRDSATQVLKNLKNNSKKIIKALIQSLNHKNPHVRICAAEALGKDFKRVIPVLIQSLNHKDRDIRSSSVFTLGKLGNDSETVVNALIKTLNEDEFFVRQITVEALGNLGKRSEGVVNALIKAINDFPDGVSEALEKLVKGSPEVISFLLQSLKKQKINGTYKLEEILCAIGEKAVAPIIALFEDNDGWMRWMATKLLIQIGTTATPQLFKLLQNDQESSRVRAYVARILGEIGGKESIAVLRQCFQNENESIWVRSAIASALQNSKSSQSFNK